MAPKRRRYCRFNSCKNSNTTEGIHLYRFPKDEIRCEAWVKAAQNEKLYGISSAWLNSNAYLCNEHFQNWCFMNQSKSSLVHNAVPASPKPVPDNSTAVSSETSTSVIGTVSCDASTSVGGTVSCDASTSVGGTVACSVSTLTTPMPSQDISIGPYTSSLSEVLSTPDTETLSQDLVLESSLPSPILLQKPQDSEENWTIHCSTPITRKSKRKYTPRKKLLARKVKRYRDRVRSVCLKFATYKRKHPFKQSLRETLSSQGVSEELSNFIERQVTLNVNGKMKRYTEYDKIQAYKIFSKSRAAYNALKSILELPSTRTLQRFISTKLSYPGISDDVISALKKVLEGKTPQERKFALVFDEMSLKPGVCYDLIKDEVIGFEDFGDGCRKDSWTNQALVLMLRSLNSKKKLPLGFFFSSHAVRAEKLQELVTQALNLLKEAGAQVKALICDQGANNSKLFSLLGVSGAHPFFDFKGEKVYCIFDPPHLLKNLRRSLMKYDLKTKRGIVSFKHISDFYAVDQTLNPQCAPKLTDSHVNATGLNSMKVSLAAQIFSHSVAAGMNMCILSNLIKSTAVITVEFVQEIDKLFDSLNGTRKFPLRGKKLHCAAKKDSEHLPFWKKMLDLIESWEFLQPNTTTPIKGPGPQNKTGWTLTLNSMIMLTKEMLEESLYFMTKRCNQDCLENFFSRIRGSGGNRTNPSALEFCSSYRLASINAFVSKSKYANCEADGDKFMFYLLTPGTDQVDANESNIDDMMEVEAEGNPDKDIDEINCDEPLQVATLGLENVKLNVISYLSGHLARKVMRALKLDCEACKIALIDKTKPMLPHTLFLHFKEYEDGEVAKEGGLTHPTEELVKCMSVVRETAESYLMQNIAAHNIVKTLKSLLLQAPWNFLTCIEHSSQVKEKLTEYSSMLFLKIHLREKNRKLARTKTDLKKIRSIKRKQQ